MVALIEDKGQARPGLHAMDRRLCAGCAAWPYSASYTAWVQPLEVGDPLLGMGFCTEKQRRAVS